jgi:hypothetical protein
VRACGVRFKRVSCVVLCAVCVQSGVNPAEWVRLAVACRDYSTRYLACLHLYLCHKDLHMFSRDQKRPVHRFTSFWQRNRHFLRFVLSSFPRRRRTPLATGTPMVFEHRLFRWVFAMSAVSNGAAILFNYPIPELGSSAVPVYCHSHEDCFDAMARQDWQLWEYFATYATQTQLETAGWTVTGDEVKFNEYASGGPNKVGALKWWQGGWDNYASIEKELPVGVFEVAVYWSNYYSTGVGSNYCKLTVWPTVDRVHGEHQYQEDAEYVPTSGVTAAWLTVDNSAGGASIRFTEKGYCWTYYILIREVTLSTAIAPSSGEVTFYVDDAWELGGSELLSVGGGDIPDDVGVRNATLPGEGNDSMIYIRRFLPALGGGVVMMLVILNVIRAKQRAARTNASGPRSHPATLPTAAPQQMIPMQGTPMSVAPMAQAVAVPMTATPPVAAGYALDGSGCSTVTTTTTTTTAFGFAPQAQPMMQPVTTAQPVAAQASWYG